jgi:hypothetical protein
LHRNNFSGPPWWDDGTYNGGQSDSTAQRTNLAVQVIPLITWSSCILPVTVFHAVFAAWFSSSSTAALSSSSSIDNRFFLAALSSLTFVSLVFTDVWLSTIAVGTAVVVFTPQR